MITATIVDDEPDCCESLATLLQRYCADVKILDICYSAATALQSIKEQPPQILFLDIEMPFMNGFEFLPRQEEQRTDSLATCILSNFKIHPNCFLKNL